MLFNMGVRMICGLDVGFIIFISDYVFRPQHINLIFVRNIEHEIKYELFLACMRQDITYLLNEWFLIQLLT